MEGVDNRPVKGILKASSSFDKQEKAANRRSKNAKWDEMNIMATFHPADKDYGHMKVEEPKTPYNWEYSEQDEADGKKTELDSTLLAEKLTGAACSSRRRSTPSASEDDSEEDDGDLSDSERARRREFKNRRTMHYNEFKAVQLARKLIAEEDDDDEDDEGSSSSKKSQPPADQV